MERKRKKVNRILFNDKLPEGYCRVIFYGKPALLPKKVEGQGTVHASLWRKGKDERNTDDSFIHATNQNGTECVEDTFRNPAS